jgi:hypothetical protein
VNDLKISNDHGYAPAKPAAEPQPQPQPITPVYHRDLIAVLATLVEQGKADGERARAAVARQDWRAICKLIRACTTTKELRELQP